jgi:hypothetical protein
LGTDQPTAGRITADGSIDFRDQVEGHRALEEARGQFIVPAAEGRGKGRLS